MNTAEDDIFTSIVTPERRGNQFARLDPGSDEEANPTPSPSVRNELFRVAAAVLNTFSPDQSTGIDSSLDISN